MTIAAKKELAAFTILFGLSILAFLTAGQRDFGLESWHDRFATLEDRAYTNIPAINISGRNTVYAGEKLILVEKVESEK